MVSFATDGETRSFHRHKTPYQSMLLGNTVYFIASTKRQNLLAVCILTGTLNSQLVTQYIQKGNLLHNKNCLLKVQSLSCLIQAAQDNLHMIKLESSLHYKFKTAQIMANKTKLNIMENTNSIVRTWASFARPNSTCLKWYRLPSEHCKWLQILCQRQLVVGLTER